MNIKWTEEKLNYLRECAAKQMSGSEISEALTEKYKEDFSRNAVIGKLHREKIVFKKPKVIKQVIKKQKNIEIKIVDKPKVSAKQLVITQTENPLSQWLPLLDLKDNQCRYPKGDIKTKDLVFCAAPADSGMNSSYCRYCYPIMYQPVRRYVKKTAAS